MGEYSPSVRILVSRTLLKIFQSAVLIFSQTEKLFKIRCCCNTGQNSNLIMWKMFLIWNLQASFNLLLAFNLLLSVTTNIKANPILSVAGADLKMTFKIKEPEELSSFLGCQPAIPLCPDASVSVC